MDEIEGEGVNYERVPMSLRHADGIALAGYLDGLLGTHGEIGTKWNLSDSFSISKVDATIKDKADRELFKTALLADNIASVWAFAVGYNARKTFGKGPTPPEGRETELTQVEVDARLKALAMEER